jgi:hypothetical protein
MYAIVAVAMYHTLINVADDLCSTLHLLLPIVHVICLSMSVGSASCGRASYQQPFLAWLLLLPVLSVFVVCAHVLMLLSGVPRMQLELINHGL